MKKSRFSRGTAILLTVVAGTTALTILAAYVLVRSPGAAQNIRPFRTVKADDYLVNEIDLTSDGKTMATASWRSGNNGTLTGTVSLWNIEDWKLSNTTVYKGIPEALFAPDDWTLLVVADGSVEFRDTGDGKLARTVKDGQFQNAFAISPNGKIVAKAVGYDQTGSTVRLLRVEDGSLLRTIQVNTGEIDDLAFSSDGQFLATPGFEDYSVRLWRVSDGSLVRTMKGHTFWVYSVAFSPEGQVLASSGEDGTVRLWRVSDGASLQTLQFSEPTDITFSPDGTLIAASSSYDWAKVWRVSDGAVVAGLTNEAANFGSGGKVLTVQFSPDGKTVYGGTDDSTVRMWRLP